MTGREVTEGPVGDELPVSQQQTFSPAALWWLLLIMWLPADREDRYLHNKEIYLIKKFRQHFLKDKAERICSFVRYKSFKSKFFNQLCTTALLYRQTNKRSTYFHTACPQSPSLVCWGEKKKTQMTQNTSFQKILGLWYHRPLYPIRAENGVKRRSWEQVLPAGGSLMQNRQISSSL